MHNNRKKCTAVIVAAGSGTRMGGPVPKQFMEINGKPVLAYTLGVFDRSELIDDIVIVTGSESVDYCMKEIVERYGITKVSAVTSGGSTRCCSVLNGLKVCQSDTGYVFIHDGVRAMISEEVIARGYETAVRFGSATASVASKDTIRITDAEGKVTQTPDRRFVRCIQTPQVFEYRTLLESYLKMTESEMNSFTDDAMVWEQYSGEPLHLYEGSTENIKLTTPEDMLFAERILRSVKDF